MVKGPTIKERLAVVETRLEGLEEKVDLMLVNEQHQVKMLIYGLIALSLAAIGAVQVLPKLLGTLP